MTCTPCGGKAIVSLVIVGLVIAWGGYACRLAVYVKVRFQI